MKPRNIGLGMKISRTSTFNRGPSATKLLAYGTSIVGKTFFVHAVLNGVKSPNDQRTFCDGEEASVCGMKIHSAGQGNLNPLSNSGGLQDTFS